MTNMEQQQQPMHGGRFDPELISQLKREILGDMKSRREWQEKAYGEFEEYEDYPGGPPRQAGGRGYGWRGPGCGYGTGQGRQYGWCSRPAPEAGYRRSPSYDGDWWTDREEYDYQRNMIMLRKQLQRELQAISRINQRMAQVRDPQVRAMLQEILSEAWQKGMDIPDIMQSLSGNNMQTAGNMQYPGGSLSDRLGGFFRGFDRRSFGWGAGVGLLGLLLVPSLTKALRPMVRKAMEEAMDVSQRAQGVIYRAKEEFEDIVAEASFNKMKESLEEDVAGADEKTPPQK